MNEFEQTNEQELSSIWNDAPGNPIQYIFYPALLDDDEFLAECISFSRWAARKLGYPVVDIELKDENFYSCLQEAYLEFNSHILGFEASKNNVLYSGLISKKDSEGNPINLTKKMINQRNSLAKIVMMSSNSHSSDQSLIKKISIDIVAGKQDYDLKEYIPELTEQNTIIKIINILQRIPRRTNLIYFPGRYSTMMTTSGYYIINSLSDFVQKSSHAALATQLVSSHHGAVVRKNRYLTLFPIPYSNSQIFIEYSISALIEDSIDKFNTIADVNYQFYPYSELNEYSRTWIRNYGLASAKELLGLVRGKYSVVPGPMEGLTLNSSDLIQQGSSEKERLIAQLREDLQRTIESSQIVSQNIENITTALKNQSKGRVFLR